MWRLIRGRKRIPRTGVYPCLSPCDGCKDPAGVMVGLTENIQACLRIFRRAQHLWLARDILHQPQGVYYVFVLWPPQEYSYEKPSSGVLPSRQHLWWAIYIRGRCPRLLIVVPSRHQSACGVQSVVEKKLPEDGGISVFVQFTQDFPGEQRNGGNNLPIGKTGKTFAASDLCTIFAPQKREDC